MTKTTKVFATLGVVAGLGVAALPLGGVFAAPASVSGDVDLYVDVQPAIAMTISGNNDDNSGPGDPGDNGAVDVFSPESTSGDEYEVNNHPEAHTTLPSSSYVALLPNSTATMTSTVTVYTNNASGYTLAVKDADGTTALTRDNTDGKGAATIPASAAPTAGTAAGWSIAGGNLDASAITAAGLTVKTTNAKTSNGDATTMTYTVATSADQATGIYSDTITYTATTNN